MPPRRDVAVRREEGLPRRVRPLRLRGAAAGRPSDRSQITSTRTGTVTSTFSRGILYRVPKSSPRSSVPREDHAATEPAARRAAQRRQAPKYQPTNSAVDSSPRTSSPTLRRRHPRGREPNSSSTPRSWRTAYGLNEEGVPTRSDKPHPQPHVPCSRALPCIGGYPPCFNVSALREVNVPPWGTWRRWAQAGVLPQPRQPRRSNGDRPHSATTTSV